LRLWCLAPSMWMTPRLAGRVLAAGAAGAVFLGDVFGILGR
jgi:hypothetical protein